MGERVPSAPAPSSTASRFTSNEVSYSPLMVWWIIFIIIDPPRQFICAMHRHPIPKIKTGN